MNVYIMYRSKLPKPVYSDSSLDKLWWSCSSWPIESLETIYDSLDLYKKYAFSQEATSPFSVINIILKHTLLQLWLTLGWSEMKRWKPWSTFLSWVEYECTQKRYRSSYFLHKGLPPWTSINCYGPLSR